MRQRHIRYRGEIKVSPSDLQAARAGRKVCTIRLGTASVAGENIDLTDGRSRLRVAVTRIDTSKRFGQLGIDEAKGEGFNSITELRSDLARYYRNLDDQQPVTIIWFAVQPDSTGTAR